MKTVYSDLHGLQHAEAEYIRGKRVASFEMPRRVELVLERVRAVALGPVVGIGDYGPADVPALRGVAHDIASARRMAAAMDVPAANITVLRDRDGGTARDYGVKIYPTTIAVDRAGRARSTVTGEIDWLGADAARWLRPLLESRAK